MMVVFAVALVWCLMSWVLLRSRSSASAGQSGQIEFAPTEEMSEERLFGCLLSANFAVLMRDNFNQLASALPAQRAESLLAEHWGIESRGDCVREIDRRIERLGEISPAEIEAVAAWISEQRSGAGNALPSMSPVEHLRATDGLTHGHLCVLAWDIQQLAYLLRLAVAVGHASQSHAEAVLERLAMRARMHYGSWKVYSLAALVGLGMRSSMEVFETSAWELYSRTHSVLLRGRQSPTRFAASWSVARSAASRLPASSSHPAFGAAA